MSKIYYLCFYPDCGNIQNRLHILSSFNKTNYIVRCLVKSGHTVEIISSSFTKNPKSYKGKYEKIDENVFLKTFFTSKYKGIVSRLVSRFTIKFQLFFYLLKLNKKDVLIVYHSMFYSKIVNFVHKIKKFSLILETEEIYSEIYGKQKNYSKEIKQIMAADRYIFPTELLCERLKVEKKYCIIYGVCEYTGLDKKMNSNTIRCVYAGTFFNKKGVSSVIEIANYLSSDFSIDILGFGTKDETSYVKDLAAMSNLKNQAKINFIGEKRGADFIDHIRQCDIGICAQDCEDSFNSSSFPSKIMTYLCNGLNVVSSNVAAVKKSAVKDLICFSENSPFEFAKKISIINLNPEIIKNRIILLDEKCVSDLENITNFSKSEVK